MVSTRKAQANRRNSLNSTGPKTARGKEVSARNATRHGFFSRHLLAPGEDESELRELRRQLIDDFRPQNAMEMILVERIISSQWKLRRLQAAECAQFAADAQVIRADAQRQAHCMAQWLADGEFREREEHMSKEEFKRRRDGFAELGEADIPASSLLAESFRAADSPLYKISIYEHRLERAMFRAMNELRRLRHDEDPADLPPSPYALRDEDAKAQAAPAPPASPKQNVRNEPTASPLSAQVQATPKLDAKIVMLRSRATPLESSPTSPPIVHDAAELPR